MDPVIITLMVLLLLFSVILHEVGHGLAARYFGDHTAEHAGRLTLNPLPHIDPIGTILLPILLYLGGSPILFGWAKPVPINPLNFRNIRQGELVVSLAGVGANFSLAVLAAIVFHLAKSFFPEFHLLYLSFYMVSMNLALAIFNLLPIPPLDGSKVLMSQLPYQQARQLMQLERYSVLIFLLLVMFPIGGTSILNLVLGVGVHFLRTLLGVTF